MIYVFIYNNDFGDREAVKELLNNITAVRNWRYDLPNAFYLDSEETADNLANLIIEKKPNVRFLLTEVSRNMQGWLPKETWDFLKEGLKMQ